MSPYSYLLLALLYTGAVSAEPVTCPHLRPQSDVHMNQVYGEWFAGKANNSVSMNKTLCFPVSIKKFDESTFKVTANYSEIVVEQEYTIENTENAGTWQTKDGLGIELVLYLSADGTAMGLANCVENRDHLGYLLLSRQLPISSDKVEEFRHAVQNAGLPAHPLFSWESEAVCPAA